MNKTIDTKDNDYSIIMKDKLWVTFDSKSDLGFTVCIKRGRNTILIENFSEHDAGHEYAIKLADLLECKVINNIF